VTDFIEYTGYTSADKTVQLRSQVRGYLESTQFKPRDRVKTGQTLFQIDPRPFQAEVDKAQAQLEVAQAQLNLAQAKLSRMEEALKTNAISEVQVIEQRADRDKARADINACKAQLETAQLNLAYTRITAPIDGIMGLDNPKTGDLIDPQQTLMSTITDDSIVYIYFNVSEYDVLRVREAYKKSGGTLGGAIPPIPVYVSLADEKDFPHKAVLDYVAPQVDRETGTIKLRARFDNANHELMGGLFVRVRMPISDPYEALLVAEKALGMDQGQRYALVVNADNVVEYRPIEEGQLDNGLRVVLKGLGREDWVIVNGLQRVRPGLKVTPQKIDMVTFMQATVRPSGATAPASAPAAKPAN
jgi:RND family efflux transporter MFP subunit